MLPVEISVGHTISPCWLFNDAVSWKAQPDCATALPNAVQLVLQRSGTLANGPTKRAAELLVTEVVVPLLTTALKTESDWLAAVGSTV